MQSLAVLKVFLISASAVASGACVAKERPTAPLPVVNTPGARQTSNSSTVDRADATAQLAPTDGSTVTGRLRLTIEERGVRIVGTVTGLAPDSKHGIHIHERGDCSAADASSAGGHYNPRNHPHGGPGLSTHLGDLGNLRANGAGVAYIDVLTIGATLGSNPAADIAGKAIVVHADADDLTTQPSGNSGARLACGVIQEPAPQ